MSTLGDIYRSSGRPWGRMLWDLTKALGASAGIMAKEKGKELATTVATTGLEEGKKLLGKKAVKLAMVAAGGYLGKDNIEQAIGLLTSDKPDDKAAADKFVKDVMELEDDPKVDEKMIELIKKAISRGADDDEGQTKAAPLVIGKSPSTTQQAEAVQENVKLLNEIVKEEKGKEGVVAGDTTSDDIKAQTLQPAEEVKKKEEQEKIHKLLLKAAIKADKAIIYPSYLDKAETLIDYRKKKPYKTYQYNPVSSGIVHKGQAPINSVFGKAGF